MIFFISIFIYVDKDIDFKSPVLYKHLNNYNKPKDMQHFMNFIQKIIVMRYYIESLLNCNMPKQVYKFKSTLFFVNLFL